MSRTSTTDDPALFVRLAIAMAVSTGRWDTGR
jgi:hypothetical protein